MVVISWILFGLVVGLVARFIMPGPQRMGIITTTLLGIVGSLLGGYVASLLAGTTPGLDSPYAFDGAGFIGSVLGAIVILAIAALAQRRMPVT